MNNISEHIYYLTRRHDCIVVPGWGAFVSQYHPARLGDEGGEILPPARSLGFNPSITHNDGMLASSVSRRNGIGYDNAVELIAEEVNALRHQLESDGEVAIPRVGVFRSNGEGTAIFEPFAGIDTSSEFIGLKAVGVCPLSAKVKHAPETDSEEHGHKDVIYLPISRNIFKVAASLLLLIGLGFVLSTPLVVDDSVLQASMSTPAVTMPEDVRPASTEGLELFIAIPSDNGGVSVIDTVECRAEAAEIVADIEDGPMTADGLRIDDNDSYCLVVASLASRELAEEYVAAAGIGQQLEILEKDGRFRVYAATGATFSQAVLPLQDPAFAAEYPGAWVCRR